jgi:hypothetical protein
MIAIGCKGQASQNILRRQLWEIIQNLLKGHLRRQPTQHVIDRNSHMPNAGFPSPFVWLDRNNLAIVRHGNVTVGDSWRLGVIRASNIDLN